MPQEVTMVKIIHMQGHPARNIKLRFISISGVSSLSHERRKTYNGLHH